MSLTSKAPTGLHRHVHAHIHSPDTHDEKTKVKETIYGMLIWFECEMSLLDSCVWTLCPRLLSYLGRLWNSEEVSQPGPTSCSCSASWMRMPANLWHLPHALPAHCHVFPIKRDCVPPELWGTLNRFTPWRGFGLELYRSSDNNYDNDRHSVFFFFSVYIPKG